jgi:hypothetical protein
MVHFRLIMDFVVLADPNILESIPLSNPDGGCRYHGPGDGAPAPLSRSVSLCQ